MPRSLKPPPNPLLASLRVSALDDGKAAAFLEEQRWGPRPTCPTCASEFVYQMLDRKAGSRNKDFRWRCRGCRRMFTVRTGIIMEESRLPLRVWVHAFWRASASRKGVSALQIARECNLNYKSALFLLHRIREAIGEENGSVEKLRGTVEADEAYIGASE